MKIGITGASGNIGAALTKYLNINGHEVITLIRPDFDLRLKDFNILVSDLNVLIHCAYDFSNSESESIELNVNGSKRLFESCMRLGITPIFLSSLSSGDFSIYGRNKKAMENFCLKNKIKVIRPGLVFGDGIRSTYYKLKLLVRKFKVVIYPSGTEMVQYLTDIQDLNKSILEFINKNFENQGLENVVSRGPIKFKDILNEFNPLFLIPIHWKFMFLCLKALEFFKINVGFSSDSLKGLVFSDQLISKIKSSNLE